MVFSAPEITTVSKPKRNPARAEVSDQKKMRPFMGVRGGAYHRTARSAVTPVRRAAFEPSSIFYQRIIFFAPATYAAVHRNHVGISHLLQIVGRQGRAESAAAVQNHFHVQLRNSRLDIALDHTLAKVNRTWKMIFRELALFAHIHEKELVASVHSFLYRVDIGLANSRARVVNYLEKSRRMLVGHKKLLLHFGRHHGIKPCSQTREFAASISMDT